MLCVWQCGGDAVAGWDVGVTEGCRVWQKSGYRNANRKKKGVMGWKRSRGEDAARWG